MIIPVKFNQTDQIVQKCPFKENNVDNRHQGIINLTLSTLCSGEPETVLGNAIHINVCRGHRLQLAPVTVCSTLQQELLENNYNDGNITLPF